MIQWILFDKDGTLIYFDQSWTRIGIQLVDDFIERYRESIADVEQAYKDLGVVDRDILPGTVMASGSLEEMIAHLLLWCSANINVLTFSTEMLASSFAVNLPAVMYTILAFTLVCSLMPAYFTTFGM